MARRTLTSVVVAVVVAGSAAWAAASQGPDEPITPGTERRAGTAPSVGGVEQEDPGPSRWATPVAEPDDPCVAGHGTEVERDDSSGEPPWHLLPEDDRPEPVEQPECDVAVSSPVAC